ncbi:molecular chaperone [Providencia rustigianii]|uniref:fimbrial biogenesis chaperone n=1 Tax=Providencia rustigianii TaxID=158850 RepID=UPI000D8D5349|nr:fimbria/pilus periplasmic chaperone [Providencia rustigianii]SPY76695.1 Chaperone protein papD precursor [Providencia rustigianii]
MNTIRKIIISLFLFYSTVSFSSVTMVKTRIIYSSDSRFEILKFMNNDGIPYIMQVWADKNNVNSTPDNADAPFIAQPPVFRIEPKTGRDVRLIYSGEGLPQDRESIFYLNVAQIPPKDLNQEVQDGNSFSVIIRHRLKLFYRPVAIQSELNNLEENITFYKEKDGRIRVKNDSPFFVSFSSISVSSQAGKKYEFESMMIPPLSTEILSMNDKNKLTFSPDKVSYKYINDLGGQNSVENKIH